MKFTFALFLILTVTAVKSRKSQTTLAPCILDSHDERMKLPCGIFIAFDPSQQDLVMQHGFSAGKFSDWSEAYVGHAINLPCDNEFNCPARLSVTGSRQGAFMACQNEHHEMVGMRFLLKHPDLKWVKVNTNNLFSIPELVKVKSTDIYTFHIGRINLTRSDGSTYTVVSKVYGNNVLSYSLGQGFTDVSNPEVLSC